MASTVSAATVEQVRHYNMRRVRSSEERPSFVGQNRTFAAKSSDMCCGEPTI